MEQLYNRIAYRTSAMVTRTYSTSFSMAVRMLPAEQRRAIYSIYGFVRFADEIVDTFLDNDQQLLLENFERDLKDAFTHGLSMNPVLHAFAATVKKYGIPQQHIDAFMKSMRTDLRKHEYRSNAETMEYIHGSAEVVGLMCLKIFLDGDEYSYRRLEQPAMKLGSAFQKVNFLRDLKADTELLHRSYFPELTGAPLNEEVKAGLIADIEAEFREAREGIGQLPGRTRLAVLVAYHYYLQLLRNIRNKPADTIMKERIRVSNPRKFILLFKSAVIYKLRLNQT
jgi:phytoene/squalene synthetase